MSSTGSAYSGIPRPIRSAPDPLGLYLHVGRNDHAVLLDLLARGDARCYGIVIEATSWRRHRELVQRALAAKLDVILDPRTQAAATIGGHTEEMAGLPWGSAQPQLIEDFRGAAGQRRVRALADFAIHNGYTQVVAPTHLISTGDDPWLSIDRDSTHLLRERLDSAGARSTQIVYSLALPYSMLRDEDERHAIAVALAEVPADSIWLRVESLGSDATANGVRSYILAAEALKSLEKPLIADGIGGLAGLSLLAFGSVGGIGHGVTFGERVDHSSWRRPRDSRPFGRPRRVYVPDLDLMLDPSDAQELIRSSGRATALLGCPDTLCCPRGIKDMLENPARHFLIQRMKQIGTLGRVPLAQRAQQFIDETVRPASDVAVQATNWKLKNEELLQKLKRQRRRLDAVRVALAGLAAGTARRSPALPRTRMARELRSGL